MKKIIFALFLTFASGVATADTFEIGWDRPGFDYTNFELNNPREILCQWQCQKNSGKCKAWTFVNPGVQGTKARCWLKYAIPRAVPNKCCTSGYITGDDASAEPMISEEEEIIPTEVE